MSDKNHRLLPRRAYDLLIRRMEASRVVVVNGARQSGKTELLRMVRSDRGGTYVSLDRQSDLKAARSDPSGFVTGFPHPLFIDEVQRGGDPLVLAIKYQADLTRDRGRFVVAGSTRFLTEPRLSESLVGRARFVDLWPLSQGEIDQSRDGFVDAWFAGTGVDLEPTRTGRSEIFERICRGGFPEAVQAASARGRTEFFADYARTVATKDIRSVRDLSARADLQAVLDLLAAQTSCELNVSGLARRLAMAPSSMRRYLPLFETIFIYHSVPAWSRNLTTRVVRRPKAHLVDSGLAAYLMGEDPAGLTRPGNVRSGALLETFVAGELARSLTWSDTDASLHHWRDRDGHEVDLMIVARGGSVIGVEVKAAVDVHESDFRGLRFLQRLLGDSFIAGMVIHCGDMIRPFGPGLWSVPVHALWETPPPNR